MAFSSPTPCTFCVSSWVTSILQHTETYGHTQVFLHTATHWDRKTLQHTATGKFCIKKRKNSAYDIFITDTLQLWCEKLCNFHTWKKKQKILKLRVKNWKKKREIIKKNTRGILESDSLHFLREQLSNFFGIRLAKILKSQPYGDFL